MKTFRNIRVLLLGGLPVLALAVLMAGCDVFGVQSPGLIQESDLDDPRSVGPLVTGMSSDLSAVLDDIAFLGARLSDEMAASGSYFLSTQVRYGFLDPEDVNFYWEGTHRARYNAENGLERMRELEGYEFEGNPLTARAYLLAGFSNRMFGENFCRVVFDGSEAQPSSVAFQRAIDHFTNAIDQAEQAGEEDIKLAAYGGRAQAYVGLGEWDNAVADAQQVPMDFVYNAAYSDNSSREQNEEYDETHQRYEMSAYGALAMGPAEETGEGLSVVPEEDRDPRAPYTDCRESGDCSSELGADGETPHLRQEKLDDLGADIPLAKGAEMRLIEAEAALRDSDLDGAMNKINEVRAFYGLDEVSASAIGETGQNGFEEGTAWAILDDERHLTLWLEGRRLHDLRRWDHPFLYGTRDVVYEQRVQKKAACIPISESECDTNENITCELPYVE